MVWGLDFGSGLLVCMLDFCFFFSFLNVMLDFAEQEGGRGRSMLGWGGLAFGLGALVSWAVGCCAVWHLSLLAGATAQLV